MARVWVASRFWKPWKTEKRESADKVRNCDKRTESETHDLGTGFPGIDMDLFSSLVAWTGLRRPKYLAAVRRRGFTIIHGINHESMPFFILFPYAPLIWCWGTRGGETKGGLVS